jgi:hypothetical protein
MVGRASQDSPTGEPGEKIERAKLNQPLKRNLLRNSEEEKMRADGIHHPHNILKLL